ncbi:MAG: rod shape-determining protein MreC [Candidatus Paceibacterota bacterium]
MQKSVIGFRKFIFTLFIIFVLLTLNSWGYLQGAKNAVLFLLSPVQSQSQSSSNVFSNFFYTISKIDSFKDENEKLQEENLSLTYELSKSDELQRENEILRKQLKFEENLCGESDCIDFQMGRIIGRSPDGYGEFILIDLGSENGVINNQAVAITGGVMIGKVVEVFSDYSRVMLVVSPESSVNCLTQTTRANGLVRGKYGTGARLEMIDQSKELVQGDLIITSGLETDIPKGLLVGKIQNIEESPNTVFKSAGIELFADLGYVEEIFLVKQNAG